MEKNQHIRNFSIIAHIDHGKSTLADRLLEITGALSAREMAEQVLDTNAIERQRGITIKAHSVRLEYKARDGQEYVLNLIDTPGHVDFSYEVSRSLAACEGVLLVVDAAQGVEAQTLANAFLAIENNLTIIPVINKIDLPSADVDRTIEQLQNVVGFTDETVYRVSAKTGLGVPDLIEGLIRTVPYPKGDPEAPLKALIFDSWYDNYRGVIVLVRVFEGTLRVKDRIRFMSNGQTYDVTELAVFTPKMRSVEELRAGEVGCIIAAIKRISDTNIGDTVTNDARPTDTPLPGFHEIKPMVFAGLYPTESTHYESLRDALEKLKLNDSSFFFEPESSVALGFGFRCGFLGLLHMEIIQQRLENEFAISLITTAPGVRYRVTLTNGEVLEVENPSKMPSQQVIEQVEEPIIRAMIMTRDEFVGPILSICEARRGVQQSMEYLSADRVLITYDLPLNEIVIDFYDALKSVSRGYASFDYNFLGYQPSDLVKLDILVNGEAVDALSLIIHKEKAYYRGRALAAKMKSLIPRQLFEVTIQAAIGAKIIARETVSPLRKNVIAKCYGGDITRKRKLLEKQKEGKKRMKRVGKVDIPQEAFLAILKEDSSE
ncbi:MAG TPA: translation elongation factor 4 [Acidobacteriota bacterium]|nr:translation elongation factor 4 [Acidobacteriota bacterium]